MPPPKPSFYVKALWDPEVAVWVSESDIPGLVIEADDLGEFEALTYVLAPEMLADNLGIHGESVTIDLSVAGRRELQVT